MSIAAFSIRRRVTVFMVTIGILVLGFFSLDRLELKLLPEISYPSLTIRTEMEGAPPEEIENLISRPVEEVLGIVSSLQQITSVSRAGLSDVIVEFHWNTPMDKALMDVREKLDTVILPDNAERPRILRYNPETEPIMTLALTGDDLVAMHSYADQELKPKLETLPGVAAVRIMGGDEEEILIELDTRRLASMGLTIGDISSRLAMENINLPGGILEEGASRFLVRTLNEFLTDESIGEVVIHSQDGTDIRLNDIATVSRSIVDRKTITRLNGKTGVVMDVYKEGDANIIQVADAVRTYQERMKSVADRKNGHPSDRLPENIELEVISDQSTFIRAAIREVRMAALAGCLLAVAVIYVFLRHLPNTMIIGLSIPISVIATFSLMYFRGITLNLMSLGGLALGIGMLVDNSIVVLENIFRLREQGMSSEKAARKGTEQVTTAVIASTLTTIAVFFPIVFVSGIAGQLFHDLAWTIAFSLLASLIVALSFIPMVSSLEPRRSGGPDDVIPLLRVYNRFEPRYRHHTRVLCIFKTMTHMIRQIFTDTLSLIRRETGYPFHRVSHMPGPVTMLLTLFAFPFRMAYRLLYVVLTVTGAVLINGSWLVCAVPSALLRLAWTGFIYLMSPFLYAFNAAFNWLQNMYRSILITSLRHPSRTPSFILIVLLLIAWFAVPKLGMNLIPAMAQGEFFIDLKLPVGSSLEDTQQTVSSLEDIMTRFPEFQYVSSVIGSDLTTTTSLGAEQEHMATLKVLLKPEFQNPASEERIIENLRNVFSGVSGIQKLDFRKPSLFTLRNPLLVEIRGNQLDELMTASRELADQLRADKTFRDVTTSMETGYPEIQVVFDRVKLARVSMTPEDAAIVMRNAVEGNTPTRYGMVGEEIDIRVRSSRAGTMTPDDLGRLVINPKSSSPVYLNAVADITRSIGPSEIRRVGQRRVALVKTETPLLDLQRAADRINGIIARQPIRSGIHYAITGQTEEMRESARSLLIALCMAVFLVYLVMASQFESLLQPLIILFSIPLGFIGVIAGLYIFQIPLSIVVFIGLIILAGIVVNNAIVLVDTTNHLIRSGTDLIEAIQKAADQRLRPILMTAMTTILGLLPMALASGPGEEIRQPLAITVVFGLIVSTFLTLVMIPALYALLHRRAITPQQETMKIEA